MAVGLEFFGHLTSTSGVYFSETLIYNLGLHILKSLGQPITPWKYICHVQTSSAKTTMQELVCSLLYILCLFNNLILMQLATENQNYSSFCIVLAAFMVVVGKKKAVSLVKNQNQLTLQNMKDKLQTLDIHLSTFKSKTRLRNQQ